MLRFREKKTFRRYIYSKTFLVLLLVVIVVVSRAVYDVYTKAQTAAAFRAEAEKTLAEMRKREAYFAGEIDRLKSDMGIEEEIRKKFRVAKEGEKVIILKDEPEKDVPPSPQKKTFLQKFFDLFL